METYCVKEKKKLNVSNLVVIKQQKMEEKCFGVLAHLAEFENFDLLNLLQKTKYAPASRGRNEFV